MRFEYKYRHIRSAPDLCIKTDSMTAEKIITLCLFSLTSICTALGQCPSTMANDNGNGDITLFFEPSTTPNDLASVTFDLENLNAENVPLQRFGNSYQTMGGDFSTATLTGDVTLVYDDGSTLTCNFIEGVFNDPTPVDLIAWSGSRISNDIELQWSTAWEENNAGFQIQRSFDAQRFEVIAMVNGFGNSVVEINYNYTDIDIRNRALGSTAYYRLIQVDFDGTQTTSEVIAIDLELDYSDFEITKVTRVGISERSISVYFYNPVSIQKVNILVADIQGQIIERRSIQATRGINVFDLGFQNTKGNLFFLSIDNGKTLLTKKISMHNIE